MKIEFRKYSNSYWGFGVLFSSEFIGLNKKFIFLKLNFYKTVFYIAYVNSTN